MQNSYFNLIDCMFEAVRTYPAINQYPIYLLIYILSGLWSRSRESVFKTAGVGVGFLKLLELESVFQNCWIRSQESEHLQLPTPMFIK